MRHTLSYAFLTFIIGIFVLGCFGSRAEAQTAPVLTASPNHCPAANNTICTSTISWNNDSLAEVWVQMDGGAGPGKLFTCGNSGTEQANWIVPGHIYAFTLYPATSCTSDGISGAALATTSVQGVVNLSATPSNCIAGQNGLCTASITWNNESLAQVWVQIEGQNGGKLFTCGASGTAEAPWIVPGFNYKFILYPATSCASDGISGAAIAATSVKGVPMLSGSPDPCIAGPSGLCNATITWNADSLAQVWVQMDGRPGPGKMFTCGNSGTEQANSIQPGHTYVFSLYQATSCSENGRTGSALDSLTIRGANHPVMGLDNLDLALQYQGLSSGGNGSLEYQKVEQAMARKGMFDAHNMGATFMRAALTGHTNQPETLALWRANPEAYWALMDQMMNDLDAHHIKIIPTFLWNSAQFPAMTGTGETVTDMMTKSNSKSYILLKEYLTDFITRYKNRSTIEGYELTNELNLGADIDSVKYCLATYSKSACKGVGNFTTDQMIAFTTSLTAYIKSLDPSHFIESGYALPRSDAEHLRAQPEFSAKGADWTQDTLAQFQKNITDVHKGFDVISIHFYATADTMNYGIKGAAFLETVKQIADEDGKPLYVGEYGDSSSTSWQTPSAFTTGVLAEVNKLKIQYSSPWLFQYYGSDLTTWWWYYNIEQGYTDDFIQQYENTNKSLGNAVLMASDTPQIVLTWPLENTELAKSQKLFAVASTGGGASISEVEFYVDNQLKGSVKKPPYTMTIDTSALAKGSHTITAIAGSSSTGILESKYSVNVTK